MWPFSLFRKKKPAPPVVDPLRTQGNRPDPLRLSSSRTVPAASARPVHPTRTYETHHSHHDSSPDVMQGMILGSMLSDPAPHSRCAEAHDPSPAPSHHHSHHDSSPSYHDSGGSSYDSGGGGYDSGGSDGGGGGGCD